MDGGIVGAGRGDDVLDRAVQLVQLAPGDGSDRQRQGSCVDVDWYVPALPLLPLRRHLC